jgi:hypothetical protein
MRHSWKTRWFGGPRRRPRQFAPYPQDGELPRAIPGRIRTRRSSRNRAFIIDARLSHALAGVGEVVGCLCPRHCRFAGRCPGGCSPPQASFGGSPQASDRLWLAKSFFISSPRATNNPLDGGEDLLLHHGVELHDGQTENLPRPRPTGGPHIPRHSILRSRLNGGR